ncbi:MAG: acetate/propionate family kinase [Leptothrix ochracea]|uniref:acetate/propionate family kinase n=1 Tax=Leptothrix ochracea TaxID=735331 RepID=UPI0034E1F64A
MPEKMVLAVNAGSATLKFALYPIRAGQAGAPLSSGQFDVMGDSAFEAALGRLRDDVQSRLPAGTELAAIAHRIVHGGQTFSASVLLTEAVLGELEALNHLAPLHQPHNLRGVRALAQAFPDLPQIGCFDTGFHASLPDVERRLPIPAELDAAGVRRYGFHGLSYRYLVQRLGEETQALRQAQGERNAPALPGRWLLAHLGSGASLCAVQDGHSVATTMGFSALDGLMMGTRCGAIDPGVLLHLLREGWSSTRIEKLLYKDCGLAGVSGLSNDMRTLRAQAATHPNADLAIRLFTRRVVREAGALIACMGGLDGLAFTGGIGEHDTLLRTDVVQALSFLGLQLDPQANATAIGSATLPIHAPTSPIPIWVVPTDEGRIAAQDAAQWVKRG